MVGGVEIQTMPLEKAAIHTARDRVKELRACVDKALFDLFPVREPSAQRLNEAMRHAVLSPGKRIRPVLALLTAESLGCRAAKAIPAACALELVHAASLVLDDLPCMDDSACRRGQPAVHIRHGEDIAVLASVALLSQAFAMLAGSSRVADPARLQMIAIVARAVGADGLVDGQIKDLRGSRDRSATAVRDVHHQKTSVLFMAAVEIGGVVANAPPASINALRCFAEELGLAFQALDDLEDDGEVRSANQGVSMLSVLGKKALRREVTARVAGAKAALRGGDPRLLAMEVYVDLLLDRPSGPARHV